MGGSVSPGSQGSQSCLLDLWELLLNGVHSTLARLNKKKFAIEQIETKYKGLTLESQFYPELESHLCTWLGNQLSDAVKERRAIVVQFRVPE